MNKSTKLGHPIVVGTGLAGLTTTLKLLKNGISVTLLEKGEKLGGNSIKASSGINGTPTKEQGCLGIQDTVELFYTDSLNSAKGVASSGLLKVLVEESYQAIEWLKSPELEVELLALTQLGGHSRPRTHRGSGKLPPGFAIISACIRALERYDGTDNGPLVTIMKDCRLTRLLTTEDKGTVVGVEYEKLGSIDKLHSPYVVLATGGFCGDQGLQESLLKEFRPDLLGLALTNSELTSGDGCKIARRDANANLIQMDKIQVHPTGFIKAFGSGKAEDVNSRWKFLCGELLRGAGGILVSPKGERFINELDTRDKVTLAMNTQCEISPTNKLAISPGTKVAVLLLNEKDYSQVAFHVDFYCSQGLIKKTGLQKTLQLLQDLSDLKPEILEQNLNSTVLSHNKAISNGSDSLHRTNFGAPFPEQEPFWYVALVTPVLHFTMGGMQMNAQGQVLNEEKKVINGLYTAGEASGGVHGENRLGGNSLLECVVFGQRVASTITSKVLEEMEM